MKKFDVVKLVSVTAAVLGVAGTLLSGWASQKTMDKTIATKVEEALAKKALES